MRLVLSALVFAVLASPAATQDTLVVRANGAPTWGAAPRLIEELRLGTLDGPLEESFGRVTHVLPIDGDLLVADYYFTSVRHFDSDGTYLGEVGGSGSGPGEFFEIADLRPHPDGLVIWDRRNGRISIFSEDGGFTRSVPYTTGFFTGDPFQVDTAGNFYAKARANDTRPPPGRSSELVWVKLDPKGEVVDSIPLPVASHLPGFFLSTPAGPLRPFSIRTHSALSPHGYLVTGTNSDYALHRPLADGRTLRIQRDFERVPIAPDERREWRALLDWVEAESDSSVRLEIPGDTKPAFREISVDLDGRIWVARYVQARFAPEEPAPQRRPPINWREPPVWDVIDPRGAYLGTVAPPEGRLAAATGLRVWMVETGDFDEEYVVRYRIEPGSRR